MASVISPTLTAAWTWREASTSTSAAACSLHPRPPCGWSTAPVRPAAAWAPAASKAVLHQISTGACGAFRLFRMCRHCCINLLCAFSRKKSSCRCRWVPGWNISWKVTIMWEWEIFILLNFSHFFPCRGSMCLPSLSMGLNPSVQVSRSLPAPLRLLFVHMYVKQRGETKRSGCPRTFMESERRSREATAESTESTDAQGSRRGDDTGQKIFAAAASPRYFG